MSIIVKNVYHVRQPLGTVEFSHIQVAMVHVEGVIINHRTDKTPDVKITLSTLLA